MRRLTLSKKQWIFSFLFVDAAFWIFIAQSCMTNTVGCFESSNFGIFFFYAPFWLLASTIPDISVIHYPLSTIVGAFAGILGHMFLGFGIGHFLGKEPVQWRVSLPIALAIVLIIIVASLGTATNMGIFN